MALNGGVTLNDLLSMPLKQYTVLRKAVELVELERRKMYIHDTAMSFSDPNKAVKELDRTLKEINKGKAGSGINWEADKDSIKRAKRRWMR